MTAAGYHMVFVMLYLLLPKLPSQYYSNVSGNLASLDSNKKRNTACVTYPPLPSDHFPGCDGIDNSDLTTIIIDHFM